MCVMHRIVQAVSSHIEQLLAYTVATEDADQVCPPALFAGVHVQVADG